MTAKELREMLTNVPDDTPIIISADTSDFEYDQYVPAANAWYTPAHSYHHHPNTAAQFTICVNA